MDLQNRDVKSKQLTLEQRHGVLEQLLQMKKNQKLEHSAINKFICIRLLKFIVLC